MTAAEMPQVKLNVKNFSVGPTVNVDATSTPVSVRS
jgi:hypothetical protein